MYLRLTKIISPLKMFFCWVQEITNLTLCLIFSWSWLTVYGIKLLSCSLISSFNRGTLLSVDYGIVSMTYKHHFMSTFRPLLCNSSLNSQYYHHLFSASNFLNVGCTALSGIILGKRYCGTCVHTSRSILVLLLDHPTAKVEIHSVL